MLKLTSPNYRLYSWVIISILMIICDQITKYIAVTELAKSGVVTVNQFFNLTLLFNRGAAFSFLSDYSGWQQWFLSFISITISAGIVYILPRVGRDKLILLALSLILGGAIGNCIDRISYGYVIDFLHFHYQDYHFAVFNIADSAITVGSALLIIKITLLEYLQSPTNIN